jgi:hypothetical protein
MNRAHVRGEEHRSTLIVISNLGFLLQSQRKLAEAEPYDREALEKQRCVLGEEHPSTLKAIGNLGVLLKQQGKLAEAEPYYSGAACSARSIRTRWRRSATLALCCSPRASWPRPSRKHGVDGCSEARPRLIEWSQPRRAGQLRRGLLRFLNTRIPDRFVPVAVAMRTERKISVRKSRESGGHNSLPVSKPVSKVSQA